MLHLHGARAEGRRRFDRDGSAVAVTAAVELAARLAARLALALAGLTGLTGSASSARLALQLTGALTRALAGSLLSGRHGFIVDPLENKKK